MAKQINQRVMELIEKYNSVSSIVEDITVVKSKEGMTVFKQKLSAAEKFKIFDSNLRYPDHEACEELVNEPERIRVATRILQSVKSILSTLNEEKWGHIKEELDLEEVRAGWESNMQEHHSEAVNWCEEKLLQLQIDSPYDDYVLQPLEVKGMPMGMKQVADKEEDEYEEDI